MARSVSPPQSSEPPANMPGCRITSAQIAEVIPDEGARLDTIVSRFTEDEVPENITAWKDFLHKLARVATEEGKGFYKLKPSEQLAAEERVNPELGSMANRPVTTRLGGLLFTPGPRPHSELSPVTSTTLNKEELNNSVAINTTEQASPEMSANNGSRYSTGAWNPPKSARSQREQSVNPRDYAPNMTPINREQSLHPREYIPSMTSSQSGLCFVQNSKFNNGTAGAKCQSSAGTDMMPPPLPSKKPSIAELTRQKERLCAQIAEKKARNESYRRAQEEKKQEALAAELLEMQQEAEELDDEYESMQRDDVLEEIEDLQRQEAAADAEAHSLGIY